jgi:ribose transport system substrate-binding protein
VFPWPLGAIKMVAVAVGSDGIGQTSLAHPGALGGDPVNRGRLQSGLLVILGLSMAAWAGCGSPSNDESAGAKPATGGNGGQVATPTGGGSTPSAAPTKGGGARPKLLFITNSNADWWNAVEKGMKDGGQEFGCDVEMRRNEEKTQGQINKLQDALALADIQGVAVSVYEADAPGIIDAMRALQKAGKIVIAIDSDVAADSADVRAAYIGTNNVKAGEAAGRAAAVLRPKGGKVAVFVGTSAAANARERKDGFFKGAGSAFKEIETLDDNSDHSRARDNVQTAIGKYPDLDLLLGLWSYNAPAIAEEVGKSPQVRKRVTVVTFDLDEAAVGEIEHGNIDATVCQNPYEMGRQGVKLLKALIQKDDKAVKDVLPDGKTRDTGVRVIVPKADSAVLKQNKAKGDDVITIDEMKTWLQSKGLSSS